MVLHSFWLVLLLLVGFVLVIRGAYALVNAVAVVAHHYKLSEVAIGLLLIAMGASTPELAISTVSGFKNESDLVFGSIVGSSIINLFLVLGLSGLIRPLVVHSKTVVYEVPFLIGVILLFYYFANNYYGATVDYVFVLQEQLVFLAVYVLFTVYVLRGIKKEEKRLDLEHEIEETVEEISRPLEPLQKLNLGARRKAILVIFVGLGALILGGYLILEIGITLAERWQVSRKVLAVLIALGTAFPELITAVTASYKRQTELLMGTVVGAIMFNLLIATTVSTALGNLTYNPKLNFDLLFLFLGTLILFLSLFSGTFRRFARWKALVFLFYFLAYIYFLFIRG